MKKNIIIMVIIFIIVSSFNNYEYDIMGNTIRFRVIANSNQSKDIIMKEKVVNELSTMLFKEENNYQDVEKNIYKNLKKIEYKIDQLFKENNYNKNFYINYGINDFPQKEYNGTTIPAGKYKSLVIEIGEGNGNNYFCFLYPSLCLIDFEKMKDKENYNFKILDLFK